MPLGTTQVSPQASTQGRICLEKNTENVYQLVFERQVSENHIISLLCTIFKISIAYYLN